MYESALYPSFGLCSVVEGSKEGSSGTLIFGVLILGLIGIVTIRREGEPKRNGELFERAEEDAEVEGVEEK